MKLRASKQALENNFKNMNKSKDVKTDKTVKEAYIQDMQQSKQNEDQKQLAAQKTKYYDYIVKKLKTWQSDFLISMKDKLEEGMVLSPNMEAALDKCIARDKKPAAPVDESKLPKVTFKMKQWWIKENKLDSRVISGIVLKESAKAYLVKGYADMVEGTFCMRCGKELTEPASMAIGFGSDCASHLGIPYPTDILSASKAKRIALRKKLLKKLHAQKFELWVPKSQIQEVMTDGK